MSTNYNIDFNKGEYQCLFCNKKFPMSYMVSSGLFDNHNHIGRKSFPGIAWANFSRHIEKCKAKGKIN